MSTSTPVFYFSLHTQFQNLGDCVINEVLLRELARYGQVRVVHRCAPSWMIQRLSSVPNISIATGRGWYSEMLGKLLRKGSVAFAFKPGHHWISSKPKSLAYSSALLSFCRLIKLFGGRVIRLGISLEPMTGIQKNLQSRLGQLHHSYGVRDHVSLEYAQELGIGSAVYSPDMAFLLAEGWEGVDCVGSRMMSETAGRPLLSISFREKGPLEKNEPRRQLCSSISQYAQDSGLQPNVVEQVSYDQKLCSHLADLLKCSHVRFQQDDASATSIFNTYRKSRLIVSNRLHSLLFGWSCGSIPVPLIERSHHSKIGNLLEHLGLSELILYWDELGRFEDHCAAILADESGLRAKLRLIMEQQRQLLESVIAACVV